mgnify:CR=1 FL=1
MGKTKRNHPKNPAPKQFSTIHAIKPFITTCETNWKGQEITVKDYGKDITPSIPQDILWEINSCYVSGLQSLSNFLACKVNLVVDNQNHWAVPRAAVTDKYNYSGGSPISFNFVKASPRAILFLPLPLMSLRFLSDDKHAVGRLQDALGEYDGVQITMCPPSQHYLFNCEYRKTPEGPCPTCFYNEGRTTWLRGIGRKSSKKTKGMKKISKRNNDFLMS